MANINNSQIIKRIIEDAKIQVSVDRVPSQLAEKVVPVLISNPNKTIEINGGSSAATGTLTGYTTRSDKVFYLTGVSIGLIKDSTCDISTGVVYVQAVIGGQTVVLKRLPVITLTAQETNENIVFNDPIKIDKSSNITMTGSFSAGTLAKSLGVFGYYTEV